MRKRPGIGGLQNAAAARSQFGMVGENVAKIKADMMKGQLATFRSQLEEFARKHKATWKKLILRQAADSSDLWGALILNIMGGNTCQRGEKGSWIFAIVAHQWK